MVQYAELYLSLIGIDDSLTFFDAVIHGTVIHDNTLQARISLSGHRFNASLDIVRHIVHRNHDTYLYLFFRTHTINQSLVDNKTWLPDTEAETIQAVLPFSQQSYKK
jgi:hypothetical protein